MASIPFIGPAIKHRQPLTGARMIIVATSALFVLFLIWASVAHVDEVTRGSGKVIPSSKLQVITAADPATVSEILVKSGQEVKKGQLLARLDSPENASQVGQLEAENQSLQARVSRLTSEGTGQNVACTGADCKGEQELKVARESAIRSKVAALQASADQARREAGEAAATIQSLSGSLVLAQKQVSMLEPLAAKNIVPQTDLLDKRREVVDLQGRIASAREQQGKAMAAVREAQAQASQASFEFQQSALDERSQVAAKIAVNRQSLLGAQGKAGRAEVRSPVDGVVNDVQVTTIGGYVQPGQKIMEVVPLGEKLLVETRVKPNDIAFIRVGDRALVKVTAYDFSIYGGLDGRVVQVSADSIYDENEKQAYFTVIVETDKSYLMASGHRLPITPGMMTDTQIITGYKSVLTYLLKPVLKARSEALHER
ncbi:MAG TPA: HlyD family type I secretion periplasmic adaptor subunit [Sphingomicrobium sp.]|jgi:adhesin transport system membrane fusion protein|nr:HlyD family type I secretion periplasmic adaptor subunit [Sphingomicrobium sp.]